MNDKERLESHDPLAWLAGEPDRPAADAQPEPTPAAADEGDVETPATGAFVLQPELTVQHAAELHPRLVECLAGGGDVVLDGGAVERADGAGLQLLLAFFQAAREQGVAISWQAASETLLDNARLLGMTESLGLAGAAD